MGADTTTTTFTESFSFTAADPTIPFRVVGSYEYANAVQDLQRLVEQSTISEIKVYDKILANHPEFSFYSGMEIQGSLPPNWKPESDTEIAQFDTQFKKRGLAWMMALAKVELGATLAAYTDSKQPFLAFAPILFDRVEFIQILLEDCVEHVKALGSEELFKKVMKLRGSPDSETLAYLRRIRLISEMLDVLKQSDTPGLAEKIRPVEKKLEQSQYALVAHVKAFTTKVEHVNSKTHEHSGRIKASTNEACAQLVKSLEK